jgi:hypothetical protein
MGIVERIILKLIIHKLGVRMGSGQFAITALTPACGAEDTNFSHIYIKPNTVVSKSACK